MSLIVTEQHTPADLAAWEVCAKTADLTARGRRHQLLVNEAVSTLVKFAELSCYAGTSWGKDSMVVAHMIAVHVPHVRLVWSRTFPRDNPDCLTVRDAFLARYPAVTYSEVTADSHFDGNDWVSVGPVAQGAAFAIASSEYGPRYITGLRAQESRVRRMRMGRHGLASANTCAPIGHWRADDVIAYLLTHDLPIHPAYGYLMGGRLDPHWVRVAILDGDRGVGRGRAEWEQRYYGADVAFARDEGHRLYISARGKPAPDQVAPPEKDRPPDLFPCAMIGSDLSLGGRQG